ncbi:MAG: tetratricopeptide repeat protein [Caldithrix sp.]|nr:tetratricopeptide repeat protein [Caldithrix sp.]
MIVKRANLWILLIGVCIFQAFPVVAQKSEMTDKPPLTNKQLLSQTEQFLEINADSSLSYLKKAMPMINRSKDSIALTQAQYLFGLAHYNLGNYVLALQYYQHALDGSLQRNDLSKAALILNEMGTLNRRQGDLDRALELFKRGLQLSREISDSVQMANSLNNIGIIFDNRENFEAALSYYVRSTKIKRTLGNENGLSYNLDNLGILMSKMGRFAEGRDYFLKAIKIRKKLGNKKGLGILYNNMGEMYQRQKKYEQALPYFLNALQIARQTSYNDFRRHIYQMISENYAAQEDYQTALSYYKKFSRLKDSLYNEQRSRQLLDLRTRYETEKKEQKIALQKARLSEQAVIIQRNYLMVIGLLVTILFVAIIFILWRSRQRRQNELRLRRAQIDASLASQEQERKRFSRDLHDGIGQLISACGLHLQQLKGDHRPFEGEGSIIKAQNVLDQIHTELRNIVFNLMPSTLIQNGLIAAVYEFAQRVNGQSGLHIEVMEFDMDMRLPENAEIHLYRIIQEWTTNVQKYANAANLTIQFLNHDDELTIMMEDDGQGFDPKILQQTSAGNGWKNIQSRIGHLGGSVEVDSSYSSRGATLIIRLNQENLSVASIAKNYTQTEEP